MRNLDGGYPGAAPLVEDDTLWRAYIADSLVETVLARDVLAMKSGRPGAALARFDIP